MLIWFTETPLSSLPARRQINKPQDEEPSSVSGTLCCGRSLRLLWYRSSPTPSLCSCCSRYLFITCIISDLDSDSSFIINPIPCFSHRVSWKHRIHGRWFNVVSQSWKNMHELLTACCRIIVLSDTNTPAALVSPDPHRLRGGHAWHDLNRDFCLVKFCGSRCVCATKPSQLIHLVTER